jgi:hypothetical protein
VHREENDNEDQRGNENEPVEWSLELTGQLVQDKRIRVLFPFEIRSLYARLSHKMTPDRGKHDQLGQFTGVV